MVVSTPDPSLYISSQWQGPGAPALQKRIPTKTERNETNKVLIRREKSMVRVERHMDGLRESALWWQF